MSDIILESNDLMDEIRLFYPFYNGEPKIEFKHHSNGNAEVFFVNIENIAFEYSYEIESQKDLQTFSKLSIYRSLAEYTGYSPPWGSLTGIRPTKLGYDFLLSSLGKKYGIEYKDVSDFLSKRFFVSEKKSKIIADIIDNQKGFYLKDLNFVNLYIHIPFCPTKCSYCSFVSLDSRKFNSLINPYVDSLIIEVEQTVELLLKEGYKIFSVYIGGGTPTVLDVAQLTRLLTSVNKNLPKNIEFTVEAGRPDTITEEKLDVMKKLGVNRISVNPQTFCDETLIKIGRAHKADDVIDKFFLAKEKGFVINTDLIAGLPKETLADFKYTIDKVLELKPHNVTVHTLARKNGSEYKLGQLADNEFTEKMVDYAYDNLTAAKYLPYYLYRQKSMMCNLENIGYTLPGFQCVNNITVMEETLSVAACGAGAISKRIFDGNRIERMANLRDVKLYLEQFDYRLNKKLDFFKR